MNAVQHLLSQEERWEAIARAFGQFVNVEQVGQAKRLWMSKYSEKPSFALNHFVGECCKLFEMVERRKDIIQIALRELVIQQHGGQPSATKAGAAGEASAQGGAGDNALAVFQLVLGLLTRFAGDDAARGMRRYVIGNLERVELNARARNELQLWLAGNQPSLDSAIPVSSMQLMINLAYVSLCEYCGPVKADAILHDAIQEASLRPEAKAFDPLKLL